MKNVKSIIAVFLYAVCEQAFAFDPDIAAIEDRTVIERFPAGTIRTREKADQALREVSVAKSRMKELVEYSKRRCNENFFVNRCMENVRQAELRQFRKFLEIEAEARRIVRADETRIEKDKQARRDVRSASAPEKKQTGPHREASASAESAAKVRNARTQRTKEVKEREKLAQQKAALEEEKRLRQEQKVKERELRRAEREKKLKNRETKKARETKQNSGGNK